MAIHNHTCPLPTSYQPLSKLGSAHNILYYISAASALVTLMLSLSLIYTHLRHYRVPQEQRHIIRIILTPFIFAIICFAEIANYSTAAYIGPISQLYEAFALCRVFLLFVQFAEAAGENVTDRYVAGYPGYMNKLWPLAFQSPVVEVIATIVLEATLATGTYCETSLKPRYGHVWVSILRSVGVVVCLVAIIRLYKHQKAVLKPRGAMKKLACFKGIVGVHFLQSWIFGLLVDKKALTPSSTFSYGDLQYGLPNAILAVEMALFSLLFWYAFSAAEYKSLPDDKLCRMQEPRSVPQAIAHVLIPTDILMGIVKGARCVVGR